MIKTIGSALQQNPDYGHATIQPLKSHKLLQYAGDAFATVRAKVNRLNRRTWCTTKHPQRLADHIDIFIDVFCDRLKLLNVSPRTLRDRATRAATIIA